MSETVHLPGPAFILSHPGRAGRRCYLSGAYCLKKGGIFRLRGGTGCPPDDDPNSREFGPVNRRPPPPFGQD